MKSPGRRVVTTVLAMGSVLIALPVSTLTASVVTLRMVPFTTRRGHRSRTLRLSVFPTSVENSSAVSTRRERGIAGASRPGAVIGIGAVTPPGCSSTPVVCAEHTEDDTNASSVIQLAACRRRLSVNVDMAAVCGRRRERVLKEALKSPETQLWVLRRRLDVVDDPVLEQRGALREAQSELLPQFRQKEIDALGAQACRRRRGARRRGPADVGIVVPRQTRLIDHFLFQEDGGRLGQIPHRALLRDQTATRVGHGGIETSRTFRRHRRGDL